MKWFLNVIRNYTTFSGRARRKEYWMFILFNLIFSIGLAIIDDLFLVTTGNFGYGILSIIYSLFIIIPSLAVLARRLHDVGKSGWFMLIALIPIGGIIWLLIVLCREGNHGRNEYGEDPKGYEGLQTDFA